MDPADQCPFGSRRGRSSPPLGRQVPCFVYANVLRRLLLKKNPALYQRTLDALTPIAKQAAKNAKILKDGKKTRRPAPGYKVQTLLPADPGGHMVLDAFLRLCLEVRPLGLGVA
eukprot:876378-Prymnesium_polylepis.1